MSQRLSIYLLAGLLVLASGCGGKKLMPTQPSVDPPVAAIERSEPYRQRVAGAARVIGEKQGAIYALFRPESWNGDLVVYAHGFTAPDAPIALPTADFIEPFRDALLARGFAVAYSSWSENGYAVADAIDKTDDLRHLFAQQLGRPRRIFLTSHSLGGLAALALAERRHNDYAGALLLSGVVGGSRLELDYISHVRVLFDYFYPGVLPGDLLHLPAGLDLNAQVIGPAVGAIQTNPAGALAMSQIVQTPLPFRDGNELVASIVQAITLQIIELEDLLGRTRGRSFFDNSDTHYSGALPPELLADLNARVRRYDRSRPVEHFMDRFYEPNGRLSIPVLTLHAAFDPVVPVIHEMRYRELATAAGSSERLVQRILPRYGHVRFPTEEMASAFDELVRWVDTGTRPPGTPAGGRRPPS